MHGISSEKMAGRLGQHSVMSIPAKRLRDLHHTISIVFRAMPIEQAFSALRSFRHGDVRVLRELVQEGLERRNLPVLRNTKDGIIRNIPIPPVIGYDRCSGRIPDAKLTA